MSETGIGVQGISNKGQAGVRGDCAAGVGVQGNSTSGRAVEGNCPQGTGVVGASSTGVGVWGGSDSSTGVGGMSQSGLGVQGVSQTLVGVQGNSPTGRGVAGFSDSGQAVYGHSNTQAGVVGESDEFDGVYGISHNPQHAGVTGYNPGGLAGYFDGDVVVTGDVRLINADCAEEFPIASDDVAPGSVMVLGVDGALFPSSQAYDKRVVGIIAGAGDFKPAIVMDKQSGKANRRPVALLGKTFCKVDAQYGGIEIGDLLTTSETAGHAMRVADPVRALGAVLGKALQPLKEGCGLIPVLVALQ